MIEGKELVIAFECGMSKEDEDLKLICSTCGGTKFGMGYAWMFVACTECRTIAMINVKNKEYDFGKVQGGEFRKEVKWSE